MKEERCLGFITPRDDYCKQCLEQPHPERHYCYVPVTINNRPIAPIPLIDEEHESEFMANYTYVMGGGRR